MVLAVEKEINKMLSSGQTPSSIAKHLLRKKSFFENTNSFLDICRFMYQTGLYRLLLETAVTKLKKKQAIPWAFIIEILESQNISISKEKQVYFIQGIREQGQIPAVLTSRRWDERHPELRKLKLQAIEQINRERNSTFVKLMEDLKFIRAQGVLKKEEEILKELKKIEPENLKVHEQWLEFRERWGSHIIERKKSQMLNKARFSVLPAEEEKKQVEKIASAIKKVLKSAPKNSCDMALLFSFIGYPHLAIQILKDHLDDASSKWLYLDLLLQSKLYVDCLSFADIMESQYSKDPETIFALTYIRAKAYHGLGKKQKAKNILSDLQKVRPNYRLTYHLLGEWEKEDMGID